MNELLIIKTMDDAERAARAMSASGFFADTKLAAQAVVKILAGAELGFGPFASMTGVNIIQNKPVLAANLIAAAVNRSGKYHYRVVTMTNAECVLDFFEGKEKIGTSKFTMEDAGLAGLAGKDNWKKYPKNMLFARAISNGQKWFVPDAFNGATVYTPDEMGASEDAEGNVVGLPVIEAHITTEPVPVENISQETGEVVKPIRLIDTMSDEAVTIASQRWNMSKPEAAKELGKKKLGKMGVQEFIDWLNDPQAGTEAQ